jgi:hypothetical protein
VVKSVVLAEGWSWCAAPNVYEWLSIPHPNWEHGLARAYFPQLQPMLEIVRGILEKGLIGEEILQTFLSQGV